MFPHWVNISLDTSKFLQNYPLSRPPELEKFVGEKKKRRKKWPLKWLKLWWRKGKENDTWSCWMIEWPHHPKAWAVKEEYHLTFISISSTCPLTCRQVTLSLIFLITTSSKSLNCHREVLSFSISSTAALRKDLEQAKRLEKKGFKLHQPVFNNHGMKYTSFKSMTEINSIKQMKIWLKKFILFYFLPCLRWIGNK